MADEEIVKNAKLLAESFLDEEFTRSLKERLSAFDSEILDLNHNSNDVNSNVNEIQSVESLENTAENFKVYLNNEIDSNVVEEQLNAEEISPINDESISTNFVPVQCLTKTTELSTVTEEETSCPEKTFSDTLKEEPMAGVCESLNDESQSNNVTDEKINESNEKVINGSELNACSMLNLDSIEQLKIESSPSTLEPEDNNPPIIINGSQKLSDPNVDQEMSNLDARLAEEEEEELEEFKELKPIKITSYNHWWQMDDNEKKQPTVDKFRTLKQIKRGNTRSLKERFESFSKQNKF